MGAFRDAIWGAKNGDSKAVELLYDQFSPLLLKCSIMVYSVFNVQRKASWRMSLHLSPILGHFCKVFLKNLRNIF